MEMHQNKMKESIKMHLDIFIDVEARLQRVE